MYTLKLTSIGNSVGVVLPKELLARLKLAKGDTVYVAESPDGYRITPYDPEFERTMEVARQFGASLGKTMVTAKDTPGFIVNRLLIPYILDAVRVYENGLASREDIDTAIKLGLNHPMGPLTLLDFVGLDTTLFIADAMFEEYKDERYAAPPLLRRMVLAGQLGRKSGKGFYDYR